MRARIAATVLLLLGALFPWHSVLAADVMVGDEVVFRVADPAQAEALTRRLAELLDAGGAPWKIRAGKHEGKIALLWGDALILVVTADLAKANGSTPTALAEVWAENLRNLVRQGMLRLDRDRIELPVGGEALVRVTGLARGALEATEPSGGVELSVDDAAGSVLLRGRSVGRTRVEITRGRGRATVWVHVKDLAGRLPAELAVDVTGRPAPGGMVAQAALTAAATQAKINPGCRLQLDAGVLDLPPIPEGDTCRFSVPVGIVGGEDYFPVHGSVPVVVRNLPLPPLESNLLLVSNRPERLTQDGILLEYTFSHKEPTRLMYSHLNESRARRNLWVNLLNPTPEPVRLVVSWTWAGPERNEVHVGQTSARRFLEALGSQAGYVVTLPPRSALELAAHDMQPKALVSGFATFRILEGEQLKVEVRTALAPSRNDGSKLPHLGAPFNPFKIHPHGVFAQPYFETEAEFVAGGQPAVMRYGESPWLIDFETGLPNTGNFGVLYKMLVDLRNPDSQPRRVGLYFNPVAGPAGGTFLFQGKVYQAPFRRVQDEALVTEIELAPGETRTVEVVTFPEASSNYPAQVEFRDGGPAPSASGSPSMPSPGGGAQGGRL